MSDAEDRLAKLRALLDKRERAGPAWKDSAEAIREEIARLEAERPASE